MFWLIPLIGLGAAYAYYRSRQTQAAQPSPQTVSLRQASRAIKANASLNPSHLIQASLAAPDVAATQASAQAQINAMLGAIPGAVGITSPTPMFSQFTPIQIQGDPLYPVPGARYFVVATTHGAANAASQGNVQSKAQSLGFKDVTVSKTKPPGSAGNAQGDWYVTGTYASGAGIPLKRQNGSMIAGATVNDVWQVG